MQALIYSIVGIILLVFENLLRVSLPIKGSTPHLIFLLVIFFGATGSPLRNVVMSFLFGYAVDAISGNLPGLHAVIYALCAAIMVGGRRLFYLRSFPFQVLAIVLNTILCVLFKCGLLYMFSIAKGFRWELVKGIPLQLLLNIPLGLILFPLLFKIEDALNPDERNELFSSLNW